MGLNDSLTIANALSFGRCARYARYPWCFRCIRTPWLPSSYARLPPQISKVLSLFPGRTRFPAFAFDLAAMPIGWASLLFRSASRSSRYAV